MAEMVNVDRPSDDSEDEDARKAADDLDELAISRRSGKPATKLKFRRKPSMLRGSTAAGSTRSGTIAEASICRIIAGC